MDEDKYLFHVVVVEEQNGDTRHRILFTDEWAAEHCQRSLRHFYDDKFRRPMHVNIDHLLWLRHSKYIYNGSSRLPATAALQYARLMDKAFVLPAELTPRLIGERQTGGGCAFFRARKYTVVYTEYSFQSFDELSETLSSSSLM